MPRTSKNKGNISPHSADDIVVEDRQSNFPKPKLTKNQLFFSKIKRRVLKHVILLRIVILLGFILFLGAVAVGVFSYVRQTEAGLYVDFFSDFIFTPTEKVKSVGGRTNILIMGKGGQGHEAPDLTDTLMFVSVDHATSRVTVISLPRDIWITPLRTKLNSVYYWGNQKMPGGGLILAKTTVEEIVGQPITYGVVIDFSGFKKIIDTLGGIEVEVETSFVDNKYPIPGLENDLCDGDSEFKCRFETISFEKGTYHMDGETALKFVRSRNAEGDEGTDFARAKRQQRVIKAIETKLLNRDVILNLKKLIEIKDVGLSYTETDLTNSSVAVLARRIFDARNSVVSLVLDENLLVNPPKSPRYDNLYVFIPKAGNLDEIHKWVLCQLGGCK